MTQPRLFPDLTYEYPFSEESERQRQIRRARELWMRYIPKELHYGDCTFTVQSVQFVMGKWVHRERTAKGVINGISCEGRCIVLERNPAYRSGTKDPPFLGDYWILPENVKRQSSKEGT